MELCVSRFRLLHGLLRCHWALRGALFSTAAWTRPWTVCARFECECACVTGPLRRQICCLQHREFESNVWNTFCMKLPYMAQQVGNAYFYRLTKIKELSGSLWWMHEGRNLLRPVAGCGLFGNVDLMGVTKIWGSSRDHRFMLFFFATMGFHIARSGIFFTPTFVL